MPRSTETGNAVNLGKFASTVSIVESLGATFTPVNEIIQKDKLQAFFNECKAAHERVASAQDNYDRAVNRRRDLFKSLKRTGTRVVNAYIAAGAAPGDVEDIRAINRKLQGETSRAVKDPGSDEAAKRAYSTSQQGFINQADHVAGLAARCAGLRGFAPADADIDLPALQTLVAQLQDANKAVDTLAQEFRSAREARTRLFYDEERGMVARSQLLRSYFKSRKDGGDPLKGIQFRTVR
ncbi:hypothetical protein EPD60_10650 [Flaviaesturariibacter flavus]|uniref:Uncharacterized protein n=1 Tax=Flaviaesturariibacter flavus TaxID=2502780 RepID=A0A4R1BBP9_9BACT|nr:hypothetical protein [Flaviaesturariibacter flavus]TCJ14441.1 hypothetical protein EPD60_10650 [Flaviaesturariibacter flavus]